MSLIPEPGRGERRTRKEFKVILAYIASLGNIISVFAFLNIKGKEQQPERKLFLVINT